MQKDEIAKNGRSHQLPGTRACRHGDHLGGTSTSRFWEFQKLWKEIGMKIEILVAATFWCLRCFGFLCFNRLGGGQKCGKPIISIMIPFHPNHKIGQMGFIFTFGFSRSLAHMRFLRRNHKSPNNRIV